MKARLSNKAELDEAEIWLHIAGDSVNHADRWSDQLSDRLLLLARHPLAGEACPHLGSTLRRMAMGDYVIYYEPRDEEAYIVRILHGAQDETAQF